MLAAFLFAVGLYALVSTSYLLDHLVTGPYTNLFTNITHLRVTLFFGVGIGALVWLYRNANELKRKCVTMTRISPT